MILLIDNNEERRKSLTILLRVKGYIVSAISYENMDYYVKPFLTAYINPPNKIAESLKSEDTLSVIFTERKLSLPSWSINISSLKNIQNEIIQIYEEKCPFNKKDKIDVLGYACIKNGKFALGGRIVRLSSRERQLVSFFMFNHTKKFNLYDVVNYFVLKSNPESNILNSIYKLNRKMEEANREKIILVENDLCYFNPKIANYICPPYPNFEEDDVDRYSDYVYKKIFGEK